MKSNKTLLLTLTLPLLVTLGCSSNKKETEKKTTPVAKKIVEVKPVVKKETEKTVVQEKTHWSYSGLMGPDNWGDLDSKFSLCNSGKKQSPVNLIWERPTTQNIIFISYGELPLKVVNNGHTVQFNFPPGNFIEFNEKSYVLLQLHFHSPSEHTIATKHSPLEMHLVHKNADGSIAVLAVMFTPGAHNPTIAKMWSHIPSEVKKEVTIDTVSFNPKDLVPTVRTHYSYKGSLTTPPCSENVLWKVFNTSVQMSEAQLKAFTTFYSDNNRPTQPLNNRKTINY